MAVPWIRGTVEGIAADLRRTAAGTDTPGIMHAAATGMVDGIVRGPYPGVRMPYTDAEKLADIATVLAALDVATGVQR